MSGAGGFPVPELSGANAWSEPVNPGTFIDRAFPGRYHNQWDPSTSGRKDTGLTLRIERVIDSHSAASRAPGRITLVLRRK